MVDDADETYFGFLFWQSCPNRPPTGPATGSSFRMQCNKVLPEQKAEARFWEVILPALFSVSYEKKKRHSNEEILEVRVRYYVSFVLDIS